MGMRGSDLVGLSWLALHNPTRTTPEKVINLLSLLQYLGELLLNVLLQVLAGGDHDGAHSTNAR